jgi:phospholipid N-methyltransferase
MTQFIPQNEKITILELGAGDGVITEYIMQRMSKDSRLLTFEINNDFLPLLQKIADERVTVISEGAQNMGKILKERDIEKVDMIISAIPFLVLPPDLATQILQESKKHLKAKGVFVQMHYALSMRQTYLDLYGNLETFFVPLNIPPGYVFKCIK